MGSHIRRQTGVAKYPPPWGLDGAPGNARGQKKGPEVPAARMAVGSCGVLSCSCVWCINSSALLCMPLAVSIPKPRHGILQV